MAQGIEAHRGTEETNGDAQCVACERPEEAISDLLFWLPTAECWLCGACARVLQALVDEIVAGQRSDWYGQHAHQVRGGIARLQPGHAEQELVHIARRATDWLWDNDGDWL